MRRRLLSPSRVREIAAVVIPAHFSPEVPVDEIRRILNELLEDTALFCRDDRLVIVVDQGTATLEVLREFEGLSLCELAKNRGKAGAVAAGLTQLLRTTEADYLVTRDCDGDHAQEDMPHLVSLALAMERAGYPKVTVMGARPSLEKPMGWVRDQWEHFTNRILTDLVGYALAQKGMVLDRRYWGGLEPDIQSGYRVYSRAAAEVVVDCLNAVPDVPSILTFACEFVPFAVLSEVGGIFGQAQRLTLVEQPVTSYGSVDFAAVYGRLLIYVSDLLGISQPLLVKWFDNHLPGCSLFFSNERQALLRARDLLAPAVAPPQLQGFL